MSNIPDKQIGNKDSTWLFQGIGLAIVIIVLGIILGTKFTTPRINTNQNDKFNAVLNLIQEHYVDTINTAVFENKVMKAILNELDPHSSYIS